MMYLTEKSLLEWAGERVYQEGRRLFESGQVLDVERIDNIVYGTVTYGSRNMLTRFELLPDGSVESRCPCKACRERGIICCYVIAAAMAYMDEISDPKLERAQRIEERREKGGTKGKGFVKRVDVGTKGARDASLRIRLEKDWSVQFEQDEVQLSCYACYAGSRTRLDRVSASTKLMFEEHHEQLLYVLEDLAEGRKTPGKLVLSRSRFIELLDEAPADTIFVAGSSKPLELVDKPVVPTVTVRFNEKTGTLKLTHEVDLPGRNGAGKPLYMISDNTGFIYAGSRVYHLEDVLPEGYYDMYDGPMEIERVNVPHFLQMEIPALEKSMLVDTDLRASGLKLKPGTPSFRLVLSGTPFSLALNAYADYGKTRGPLLAKEDSSRVYAVPNPRSKKAFSVRNMNAEIEALDDLKNEGIHATQGDRIAPIEGTRKVMNFLNKTLPYLESRGWSSEVEGELKGLLDRAEWIVPEVGIKASDEDGWFDVKFTFHDDNGEPISDSDIEHALLEEKSYLEMGERVLLIDADTIDTLSSIFDECSMSQQHEHNAFKVGDIHAGYITSCTQALDHVNLSADKTWKEQAERQNRNISMGEIKLDSRLDKILRPYQKEGVSWLRYLEHRGFAGILADEMGLGKTLQTLAWIDMGRISKGLDGMPSLIVCPTSLVENWADEAKKFTPELKVYKASGPQRHKNWDKVDTADLVITSYALLRRDMAHYKPMKFAIAVLDEAQHIKNHSTQNAKAAKALNAAHRVVLTGTPIENSVTDLWSIMDYLMPNYLGTHRQFRNNYELPISRPGHYGEEVQRRLRRKIHPFIMRRLKEQVAKELPPKIQRIATCSMSADQLRVYRQVLESSRSHIYGMVAEQGFQKSRFEIFKTLLRLRQICCHLELLKIPNLKAKEPSGKLELFMELMNEAIDGGNRVLVFSQFVSMLHILRRELSAKDISYCYLDGSTKNRQSIVKKFNADSSIPVFLISLKAGGTGLNLTGADTVIHFDPWWNPAVEDQATDRAHRIGQLRTVYSVKLITKDSVEEKVLALQRKKKAIIDATLSKDEDVMAQLSWDDVQELLSF